MTSFVYASLVLSPECSQGILHACLDKMALSVEKFSRWLRAISTVLLARNTPGDRTKALGYIEQAVAVLEDHTADGQDENNVGSCH